MFITQTWGIRVRLIASSSIDERPGIQPIKSRRIHQSCGFSAVSTSIVPAQNRDNSNDLINYKTRRAGEWHEVMLVKRRCHAILVWLWISTLLTATDATKAGPFQDFFRTLRSAVAHPKETPRPHRSTHKHTKSPSGDVSNSQTSGKPTPGPPSEHDIRWAKAGSVASDEKANLPYGTPVPGKPGLVTSPFAPDAGYVQVLGFPPGSPVEDPYTGKIFLTP
jgi:hypothetical protein